MENHQSKLLISSFSSDSWGNHFPGNATEPDGNSVTTRVSCLRPPELFKPRGRVVTSFRDPLPGVPGGICFAFRFERGHYDERCRVFNECNSSSISDPIISAVLFFPPRHRCPVRWGIEHPWHWWLRFYNAKSTLKVVVRSWGGSSTGKKWRRRMTIALTMHIDANWKKPRKCINIQKVETDFERNWVGWCRNRHSLHPLLFPRILDILDRCFVVTPVNAG